MRLLYSVYDSLWSEGVDRLGVCISRFTRVGCREDIRSQAYVKHSECFQRMQQRWVEMVRNNISVFVN